MYNALLSEIGRRLAPRSEAAEASDAGTTAGHVGADPAPTG
jgi:hypothetical protein